MKSTTLAIVGNINHELMKFAINKTLNVIDVDEILICSDQKIDIGRKYNFVNIGKKFGMREYGYFILDNLVDFIKTDYMVTIQYDGFAVNKSFWNDDYYNYDYVGGPTFTSHPPMKGFLQDSVFEDNKSVYDVVGDRWFVGGGGFSLRSTKLMKAVQQDKSIKRYFHTFSKAGDGLLNSEDAIVCLIYDRYLMEKYGISYAPLDKAIEFSSEYLVGYSACVGFHGWNLIPYFLTEDECVFYVRNLFSQHTINSYMRCDPAKSRSLIVNFMEMRYYRALDAFLNVLGLKNVEQFLKYIK